MAMQPSISIRITDLLPGIPRTSQPRSLRTQRLFAPASVEAFRFIDSTIETPNGRLKRTQSGKTQKRPQFFLPGLQGDVLQGTMAGSSSGLLPAVSSSAPGANHDQAHAELVDAFRDHYGYVCALHKENGVLNHNPDGEGTLYTANAIIALATGNYHQDAWEAGNADDRIADLLTTLRDRSWGNRDGLGREHPIRHPDVYDYDRAGNKIRNSPLTKDSFGAMVAAAYYSYFCPHSSDRVRGLAYELMRKWSEYVVLNEWRLHSNYISGEFETVPKKKRNSTTGVWEETDDSAYKNIFSAPGPGRVIEDRQVDAKGPEGFLLFPQELYALQNVCARLGIPSNQWDIWSNELPAELLQTIADVAAPYLADAAGRGLHYILERLGLAIPYSIQLGSPEWNFGKIEGVFEVKIPSDVQQRTADAFRDVIRDVIKEAVRLNNLRDNQGGDLIGLAVNRILDLLPNSLGPNKWRSILVGAVQQVVPWLSGSGWIEAATFIGTLGILRLQSNKKPDVVSYSLWAYAAECETRPEMEDILKPFVQQFYAYIRGQDNPNGLWAWLAEDTGQLHEQISLFESNDARTWSDFAFSSTKFNEWRDRGLTSPATSSDNQFPRLDYLLLQALDEKGTPRGVTDVISSWWQAFVDAVTEGSQALINSIKDQFERLGRFSRDAITAGGILIRETWTKAGEYLQEQFRDGRLVFQQTWNQAGQMVSRFLEDVGGQWIEEYWNRTGEKYWKGIWDHAGVGGKMLSRFLENVSGQWIEEYWNRTGEKYWKGIWDHAGQGAKMLERMLEAADGKWIEERWGGAQKYWRGTWDKVGQGAKMVERYTAELAGNVVVEIWNDANQYGKSVFNSAGNLIASSGISVPVHLPNWWPPW